MSDRHVTIAPTRSSAFTGSRSVGCTYEQTLAKPNNIWQRAPTYEKNFENGRPLSCAKTQMRRETEAKILNNARKMMIARSEISTLAAVFDPVMP
jgi:hypothetical protein